MIVNQEIVTEECGFVFHITKQTTDQGSDCIMSAMNPTEDCGASSSRWITRVGRYFSNIALAWSKSLIANQYIFPRTFCLRSAAPVHENPSSHLSPTSYSCQCLIAHRLLAVSNLLISFPPPTSVSRHTIPVFGGSGLLT